MVERLFWQLVARPISIARLKTDFTTFLGRHVANLDRTDGLKIGFDDGSWVLLRLSGTEPLMRIYTEASTTQAAAQLATETNAWVNMNSAQGAQA